MRAQHLKKQPNERSDATNTINISTVRRRRYTNRQRVGYNHNGHTKSPLSSVAFEQVSWRRDRRILGEGRECVVVAEHLGSWQHKLPPVVPETLRSHTTPQLGRQNQYCTRSLAHKQQTHKRRIKTPHITRTKKNTKTFPGMCGKKKSLIAPRPLLHRHGSWALPSRPIKAPPACSCSSFLRACCSLLCWRTSRHKQKEHA